MTLGPEKQPIDYTYTSAKLVPSSDPKPDLEHFTQAPGKENSDLSRPSRIPEHCKQLESSDLHRDEMLMLTKSFPSKIKDAELSEESRSQSPWRLNHQRQAYDPLSRLI